MRAAGDRFVCFHFAHTVELSAKSDPYLSAQVACNGIADWDGERSCWREYDKKLGSRKSGKIIVIALFGTECPGKRPCCRVDGRCKTSLIYQITVYVILLFQINYFLRSKDSVFSVS